ncbi:caveolin-2-like [Paramormyrops kingsleyae]|uniref:caveolin-2-like n=1 Tax=Paramormyrops kingsleyae TaxID=1676925 RepID=UPI003B973727
MGLESERSETSVLMDQQEFSRTSVPILAEKQKNCTAATDRDPQEINAHLKISFEDIIGEPAALHSFDSVWVSSSALFELLKYASYRLISALLAVLLSFAAGSLFALLRCLQIWILIPLVQAWFMALPTVQTVWSSLVDTFVAPVFTSMARCLSTMDVKTAKPN